jgi:putative heme-binding domain-containing protein
LEPRRCDDGQNAQLVSSLSRSEQYTGTLRCEVIACPAELTFWLSGHNGPPDQEDHRRNVVRLVHANSGEILAEAFPPRNDQARRVAWALADVEEQPVRIEIVDGDAGNAYAWLAVGRFSDPRLERGNVSELIEAISANLLQGIEPDDLSQQLGELALSDRQRASLVAAALVGRQQQPAAALAQQAIALLRPELIHVELLNAQFTPELTPERNPQPNAEIATDQNQAIALELCATATASQQTQFAKALLGSAAGCELLHDLLAQGKLSLQALRGVEVLLPAGLSSETKQALTEQLATAAELPADSVDVAGRLRQLDWNAATLEAGEQVFKQHCIACHKLGNEGSLIGPQLDGAVVRGAERLGEDILDPNRNVDRAFRITALLLDDDSVLTGLVRDSEDGQTVTVTGQDGKSQELPASSIADRRESTQSLMPGNFAEILSDAQLAALLKFLSR